MIIQSRCRSAIHALVDLATRETGRPVTLASIAARQGISLSYLEQLFQRLRVAGLVGSVRGPGGGYYVSRPLSEISVVDVIRAVDAESRDSKDGLPTGEQIDCMPQEFWCRVDQYLHKYLATVTLDSIAELNPVSVVEAPGKPMVNGQGIARYRGRRQTIPSAFGLALRNGNADHALSASDMATGNGQQGPGALVTLFSPGGMAGSR